MQEGISKGRRGDAGSTDATDTIPVDCSGVRMRARTVSTDSTSRCDVLEIL